MIRLSSPEPRDLQGLLSGPAYEPPYDGAVQDEFAWHIVKYLREDAVLHSEVELETTGALFTADFGVEVPGPIQTRRVAFECGGGRSLRDHQRRLRREGKVDVRPRSVWVFRDERCASPLRTDRMKEAQVGYE